MVSRYLKKLTAAFFTAGVLTGITGAEHCATFKEAAVCILIMCALMGLSVINIYATEAVEEMEIKK